MALQPLLLYGIHARLVNCLQVYTGKSLGLAHEEFLLSLEFFSLAALLYYIAVLLGSIEEQEDILKHKLNILYTMERYSFSPGLTRQETKQQKKERIRKKKEEKRKEQLRKERRLRGSYRPPQRPSWLVLPYHVTKGFEFWILTLKGDTFLQKKQTLLEQIEQAKKPTESIYGFDTRFAEEQKRNIIERAADVLKLLVLNQKIRWTLKVFFTKVRALHFQKLNEVDPITMDSIVESIQFPSFPHRKIYSFEAKPFAKHIHNSLIHNDGHIPDALSPKNPLTNEVFSLPQLMSLISQARAYGHTSWAIEGFIASRYDLTTFMIIHSKSLRLHALRNTMANVDDWDSIDTLYDFIKSQHAVHDAVFPMGIYKWAVNHACYEPRIETWRKLCVKWYEVDILIDDNDTRLNYLDAIKKKTLLLCSKPEELSSLRKRRQNITN